MPTSDTESVRITLPDATVVGDLAVPPGARGMVLFAHGSGSSRHSPRNRAVAQTLREAGFGTLLMDLLTADEERRDMVTAEYRFDIPLLARRLCGAVDHLAGPPPAERGAPAPPRVARAADLPIGLFGASTGAAAALVAAAMRPERVRSVVSRGGRPDLAGSALAQVRAPVLMIVGGHDQEVLRLNEQAADQLGGPFAIHVVPGATHLFEEPGALDQVAVLAADWFTRTTTDEPPPTGPGAGRSPGPAGPGEAT
ncbi:dienelactone hydrolase family protein [Allostreptomyces psammosilenae]|uniref:Pimeloyl-ACP methyl ester carboxylesterase n=1 Tax=Allostreptomyces psammosilenae TaxID=1892865 RepID=A0A852ZMI4_9ACTN|nr:dienelactone hydrolase family protein [Allostreptomyces psammosilenae]NYI03636.1 pimeloyl-ACP methyl ester carboxylesterase [Allostreptomyces psammosilenae]